MKEVFIIVLVVLLRLIFIKAPAIRVARENPAALRLSVDMHQQRRPWLDHSCRAPTLI
ncbi:hypothetical protein PQQ53_19915 [Paraburkholderia strydomiana]|jgi:hypothetical protein|uniref:Uncharacterized protein n=1 Tax=Paraburkholderia strydomiana TaxID=1245417 RepID=A0ABW9EM05_9BURK